jgi:sugar lactone lactonase YvrE
MSGGSRLATLIEGLSFPEAPRWHDGRLWFSDFYTHRVLAVDEQGRAQTIVEVPQRPSGLGWRPDGTLLVVSMRDRSLYRVDGGKLSLVADLSAHATGMCNDMVVDFAGRAYVGNFGYDRHAGEQPRPTCMLRVDPDGRVTRVAEDLLFPNGTVITPDGKVLVVGETFAHRLSAFDIAADGTLSNRRLFGEMEGLYPDGICLDAEGAIWIADPWGKRVVRMLDGGRIDRAISTGERGAYACMLGGADRCTLFICTNTGSGPAMADKRDGRIDCLRVDVPGAGFP